jgi:class 3 adenylate cyclase
MAAVSFLKIITETRKSKKLRKYRQYKPLIKRMPGYEVKMGMGLHIGWAIEGAIGSFYKIDASYLSPNVKMSEKLEGATKIYGVPLLISGDLRALFSKEADQYLRHLDSVKFLSSGQNMTIWTIDIDTHRIDTDYTQISYTRKQAKLRRVKAKFNR